MQINLTGIAAAHKRPIKDALKGSFALAPAVTIETEESIGPSSVTISVTVRKGPQSAAERKLVSDTIDAILMRNGYKLCAITFT